MAFLLCFLAGISTLIGYFTIYIKNKDIIKYSLAFAAGVMISVSIFDLLPECLMMFEGSKNNVFLNVLLCIFIGLLIPFILDKILPNNDKLYKLGIFSMIAIIIHNLPEGILTYLSTNSDLKLGIKVSIAIAFHNLPEGISIAVPLYYATKNKRKAFIYTFISGMSELVGALFAYFFIKPDNFILGNLFGITVGIMSYISIIELLPQAYSYDEKKKTTIVFLIGVIFMYVNHLIN